MANVILPREVEKDWLWEPEERKVGTARLVLGPIIFNLLLLLLLPELINYFKLFPGNSELGESYNSKKLLAHFSKVITLLNSNFVEQHTCVFPSSN